jgi:hypothetical protein
MAHSFLFLDDDAREAQIDLQSIRTVRSTLAPTGRHVSGAYVWARVIGTMPTTQTSRGKRLSGWELQRQREREITGSLAQALGLSTEDLDRIDYMIDPQRNGDGTLQGYIIYFLDSADPEILGRITGLVNGRWVRIGPVL